MNDREAIAAILAAGVPQFRKRYAWPIPAQRVVGAPPKATELSVVENEGEPPIFSVILPDKARIDGMVSQIFVSPNPPENRWGTSSIRSSTITADDVMFGEHWYGIGGLEPGVRYLWFLRFVGLDGKIGPWSDPQYYIAK